MATSTVSESVTTEHVRELAEALRKQLIEVARGYIIAVDAADLLAKAVKRAEWPRLGHVVLEEATSNLTDVRNAGNFESLDMWLEQLTQDVETFLDLVNIASVPRAGRHSEKAEGGGSDA